MDREAKKAANRRAYRTSARYREQQRRAALAQQAAFRELKALHPHEYDDALRRAKRRLARARGPIPPP